VAVYGTGIVPDEDIDRQTDADGRCAFLLVPGRYEIYVGSAVRTAQVAVGRTTEFAFRHEGEGDLLFEPAMPGDVYIVPLDPPENFWCRPWGRSGMLFLPEGEYALHVLLDEESGDSRDLGTVLVRAGRATAMHPTFASGSVTVRFPGLDPGAKDTKPEVELAAEVAGMTPRLLKKRGGMAPDRIPAEGEGHVTVLFVGTTFRYLDAGRYLLRARAIGYRDHEQVVEVGEGATLVEVRLVPEAGR